jgi:predicted transcriptional regulator
MRSNPETSHEAHKMMTEEVMSKHHHQIIDALKILKRATYEEIANFLDWDDKNRASRRLAELERNQVIFKPGEKRKTKYGRNAYVYMLIKKEPIALELF